MIKFNEQQLEAINHNEKPAMVVAGAGSGKTAVIVNRIKRLVDEGRGTIIAITFTRNSADDLKKKLEKLGVLDKNVIVGTFHSVCGRILSMEGLYSYEKIKEYEIENLFNKLYPEEKVDMQDVKSFISYQKNYMRKHTDEFVYKDSKYSTEVLRMFYTAYENFKDAKKIIDLDDMLLKTYEVLKAKPNTYTCDYLLVDESQDSNLIQHKLAELLCPSRNIMTVGDVKQSIYAFRGAVPQFFMDFDKYYPDAKVIHLDYNYRSKRQIVENANTFIKNYYGTYEHYSDARVVNEESALIDCDVHEDAEAEADTVVKKIKAYLANGVEPSEIAVLYRNNMQAQFIENELKLEGIDYFIEKNGGFFERKEINLILCMLRLITNHNDNVAFETIVKSRIHHFKFFKNAFMTDVRQMAGKMNVSYLDASEMIHGLQTWQRKNILSFIDSIHKLSRQYEDEVSLGRIINNIINVLSLESYLNDKYTGEDLDDRLESVENLKKFIRNNTVDSFLKYVYEKDDNKKKNDGNKIQLMTVHKSKGLEFKNVIIAGVLDGKFPSSKSDDIEEEARLFYVAITRAKESLYLSQIGLNSLFIRQYLDLKIEL